MPAEPLIRVRGQGPDLVLVPGWSMSDSCWGAFADRLAARFRLHLVTFPGHGDARDEEWSIDGLIERIIARTPAAGWLGWSLGGTIALAAARAHPEQVMRLVLIAATPCFVAREHWPGGTPAFEFRRFEKHCQLDAPATVNRFRARVARGGPNPSAVTLVLERCPVPGQQSLLSGLSVLERVDLTDALEDLEVPGLWVCAGRDRVVKPEAVGAAAALHAAGQLLTVAHAGHAPHLDHPADLADQVSDWMGQEAAA